MILVTGGTGNIGNRLALALKQRGESVRVLGLATPHTENLSRENIEVFQGNINHFPDVAKACMGIHTVYHLAAILTAPENPTLFHRINTVGTQVALRAAENHGVGHFIFVSSISVTYPRLNGYSRSKLEAESWVRNSKIPWTIVRPCLVLDGLGGGDEFRAFAETAQKHSYFQLPYAGKSRKRPIHIDDLVSALTAMNRNPVTHGKTYSLGGLDNLTLGEMASDFGGRKHPGFIRVPIQLLRIIASISETASRLYGQRISRLTHQSLDGLIYDAAPEIEQACRDLSWKPRGWKDIAP